MSAEIFSSYLEAIKKTAQAKEMDEKSHVAQDVAEDSSVKRHRGAEKHKKRLAQSHAHLMKPSRSSLPFDFLSYCVSGCAVAVRCETMLGAAASIRCGSLARPTACVPHRGRGSLDF